MENSVSIRSDAKGKLTDISTRYVSLLYITCVAQQQFHI